MTNGGEVYVVDDDRSVRLALERLLRGEGWTVRSYESAEDFLKHSRQQARGCLVADVHLGQMSGLELQAALAGRNAALSVIITSGVADDDMELEARRLGASAFFRKPFDVEALLSAIRRELRTERGAEDGET